MKTYSGIYLLFAAGFSRRFGSAKQLHPLNIHNTIISTSIKALKASDCRFIVVIRAEDTQLAKHLKALDVEIMTVDHAEKGLSSVIAEATTKLETDRLDWLGICLADMPYIKASTFKTLQTHASSHLIVRPNYLEQQGHPVVFGQNFFAELAKIEGDLGAKKIIQQHPKALVTLDLDDPMIVHDIDQIEDIINVQDRIH